MHGPKGVGALYIKKGVKTHSMFQGGGHEKKIRSGTENIPGIIGFAAATKSIKKKDITHMKKLRDKIITNLTKINDVKLNGPKERLCNNVNLTFSNIEGESIGMLLEAHGILTSTGSACMSNTLEPSHVLQAIGLTHLESNGSVRITISKFTTEKEVEKLIEVMPQIVERLRMMSPVVEK
jgi:cysteine desulfurase